MAGPEMLQIASSQMVGQNKARLSSANDEIVTNTSRQWPWSQRQL